MQYEKKSKVQYRKPVTIIGDVNFIPEINKFEVITDRGKSLIDPADIIIIENINIPVEVYQSDVRPEEESEEITPVRSEPAGTQSGKR